MKAQATKVLMIAMIIVHNYFQCSLQNI